MRARAAGCSLRNARRANASRRPGPSATLLARLLPSQRRSRLSTSYLSMTPSKEGTFQRRLRTFYRPFENVPKRPKMSLCPEGSLTRTTPPGAPGLTTSHRPSALGAALPLLGGVGFIGFTTYHLATGDGPVSILGGLASGVTVFVLCWYVFGAMTGFGP